MTSKLFDSIQEGLMSEIHYKYEKQKVSFGETRQ